MKIAVPASSTERGSPSRPTPKIIRHGGNNGGWTAYARKTVCPCLTGAARPKLRHASAVAGLMGNGLSRQLTEMDHHCIAAASICGHRDGGARRFISASVNLRRVSPDGTGPGNVE